MKKALLIGIALMLCLAAVPYGTDLACVYVRPLDLRDGIYKGIGIPRNDFTDKYGGLSERTLIIGNLQIIPQLMNELDVLKKQAVLDKKKITELEADIKKLKQLHFEDFVKTQQDPNEVKR